MPINSEQIEKLHENCVTTLKKYIEEAKKTCQLLMAVNSFPVSTKARVEILQQRQAENLAHDRYQRARNQLFREAQWN